MHNNLGLHVYPARVLPTAAGPAARAPVAVDAGHWFCQFNFKCHNYAFGTSTMTVAVDVTLRLPGYPAVARHGVASSSTSVVLLLLVLVLRPSDGQAQ
eukprot:265608-Rhodomonas_salina.1